MRDKGKTTKLILNKMIEYIDDISAIMQTFDFKYENIYLIKRFSMRAICVYCK